MDPDHGPDAPRGNNCGDCAAAVFQRLNGISEDVEASGDTRNAGQMYVATGLSMVKRTPEQIENELKKLGEGANTVVGTPRGADDYGHWFNAYYDGNQVRALDGQTGVIYSWPPYVDPSGYPSAHSDLIWDMGVVQRPSNSTALQRDSGGNNYPETRWSDSEDDGEPDGGWSDSDDDVESRSPDSGSRRSDSDGGGLDSRWWDSDDDVESRSSDSGVGLDSGSSRPDTGQVGARPAVDGVEDSAQRDHEVADIDPPHSNSDRPADSTPGQSPARSSDSADVTQSNGHSRDASAGDQTSQPGRRPPSGGDPDDDGSSDSAADRVPLSQMSLRPLRRGDMAELRPLRRGDMGMPPRSAPDERTVSRAVQPGYPVARSTQDPADPTRQWSDDDGSAGRHSTTVSAEGVRPTIEKISAASRPPEHQRDSDHRSDNNAAKPQRSSETHAEPEAAKKVGVVSREPSVDDDGDTWVVDADGQPRWGRYGAAGLLLRAWGPGGVPAVLLQRRA